jgi:hypothetical protein
MDVMHDFHQTSGLHQLLLQHHQQQQQQSTLATVLQ